MSVIKLNINKMRKETTMKKIISSILLVVLINVIFEYLADKDEIKAENAQAE